jgi:two-component system, response regulator RpfG
MIDSQSLENSSILVVDDQSTSRTILSHVIKSINHNIQIIEKDDPEKALEWAAQNTADLVFVDYVMPEMNGVDFTSLLKVLPNYANVPVIMITIKKDAETRYAALDAGVADFLSKPVDVYECTARSRNLLTMRQQQLKLQNRGDLLESKVKLAIAEISAREKETLMRLARAGEYKDSETAMHLQRMSLYSKAIAEAIGFSEEDAEIVELSAPLHDIGKIGIPDSILLKDGPLNEDEKTVMRRHPIIGYEILQNSPSKYLQMGGEIALAHHERYDGLGYPYQLKADQIPLSARIVAIADVLDALTTKRPYKEAWPMDMAFAYLESESGKHFDPDIVASVISIRKTIEKIFDSQDLQLH